MNKTQLNAGAKRIFTKSVCGLAVGETVARDHEDCPAGLDTKHRLYFTRKEHPKDMVVWFCHNCSEGGAFNARGKSAMSSMIGAVTGKDHSQFITEVSYRSVPVAECASKLSPEQQAWLLGPLASHNTVKSLYEGNNNIRWDYVDNSIVFLINTPNNKDPLMLPDSIQKRYHNPFGPKCLTYKKDESVRVRQFLTGGKPITFIVEDYLSGLRLNWRGYNSYILFGNNMDIAELAEHKALLGNTIAVWLDNDNPQVIENSHKIAKRAKMLGYNVHRVREPYVDAKKYNTSDLSGIITQVEGGSFTYE